MIERVARKIAPGPNPSFEEIHVVKALEIVGKKAAVGRKRLSEQVGLGEGATRTLIRHLRKEDLIETSRTGISLTPLGERIFSPFKSIFAGPLQVPQSSLTIGPFNVAFLVRDAGEAVTNGLEERDAAIRLGALGATTLVCHGGKMILAGTSNDVYNETQNILKELLMELQPNENDVLIVGTAESEDLAELGSRASALSLLKRAHQLKPA